MQSSLASGTRGPLAGLASQGPVRGIQQFIGPCEGRQEMVKLRQGQASEGETFPPISLDFCIGNHRAMLSLFPIKSILSSLMMPTLSRGLSAQILTAFDNPRRASSGFHESG